MTIRTKRRGWRSLAAILAAMLMASVLAVVAGSPVQAANTASEALVDTNDDGKPDSRAFAGSDRYDTALRLAKHFANNDTPNSISTVIVASGETQIDAVAAAGVAGYEEAPVLLTRSDQLPKGVATFIEDQGVSRVYVAGGTAVISDDVVEQIEGLDSSPTVTRVAGDNRYGTAAALASKILSTARWCGSDDSAVFLANGNQVPITSAILAGPMSYRMQMPLLLTAEDALPAETSEYIDDNDIDRVVIIGNTGEVSDAVADDIAALGASVDRVAGDDPASTSVEVAKLMWGDCDGLPTDTTRVALVNSNATVDGVTGGPVAGRGLGNDDSPMAILLVGNSLPASVRDWLASTPEESGGQKTHLSLVAIGGTAVVSNSVMAAAVDAASTAPGLATSIRPVTSNRSGHGGTTSFTVTFSDELEMDAGNNWKRQLSDVFFVNGLLASIEDEVGDINATFTGAANTSMNCVVGASVTVTLTTPLKAGDRIEVRPTAHMFGKDGDRRLLQAASATVGLTPSSASAPTIDVIAIEGQSQLFLRSNGAVVTDSTAGDVQVRSSVGAQFNVGPVTADGTIANLYTASLTLTADLDLNGDGDTDDPGEAASPAAYVLRPGDAAWAERNVFTKDNLPSRYARDEVVSRVRSFRSSSVLVGTRDTGVNDDPSDDMLATGNRAFRIVSNAATGSFLSQRARAFIGGTPTDTVDVTSWANEMRITGLWSGDAAGAAGNDWQIAIDSNANYNAAAATPEIDVSVSNRTGVAGGGLIRVQFLAGSPTLGDLAAALMGNSEFTDNFSLSYNCGESRDVIDRSAFSTTSTYLTNGVSSVGILVNWNDWVSALAGTDGDALRDDVLGSLVPNYDGTALAAAAGITPADADTDGQTDAASSASVAMIGGGAPTMSAQIVFSTTDVTRLPGLRTGSGRGAVTFGGSYYPQGSTTGNSASGTHVAVNYLIDTDDRDTDNDDGDNNPATGVDTARTGSSEPVDNVNIGQTIRVRSGAVSSHTPGPQATS